MLKKAFLLSTISFVIVILVSCATHRATISSHVDAGHRAGEINSIAVFPIRNARLAPSESHQVNRKISQAVSSSNGTVRLISSAESQRILNEANAAGEWARFLEDYVSSGIPNSRQLRSIGEILNVDAIIQGEVVHVHQQDGRYGRNPGSTRATVRFTMLNTNRGVVVWEAQSDGLRETATNISSAPPMIEAIDLAIDKILESFPPL